jgi:glutamate dehydrogenase/leucine dehydrogenase
LIEAIVRYLPSANRTGVIQMNVLAQMNTGKHEQVVFVQDLGAGLRAIIAIHNTTLGPALGGTRMYPYATEEQALRDVLDLSRGMTYKAAASGLDLGGGKAVIIGDPLTQKSDALLRTYGRFVNRLAGLFYTGEDIGTDVIAQRFAVDEHRSRLPSVVFQSGGRAIELLRRRSRSNRVLAFDFTRNACSAGEAGRAKGASATPQR